jgi:hypothetical protein
MLRPIFTLTVSIDEKRAPAVQAKRHGLDPVEVWAAAGYLQQVMGVVVANLIQTQRVVPDNGEAGGPLAQRGGGEVGPDGEGGNVR